jgi:aspartyl aminopeptidase
MTALLEAAGFIKLKEEDEWDIGPGRKYFVTRNDSSIIILSTGKGGIPTAGFRMLGAHTDSPGLRVKPEPLVISHSYIQLAVEVYGGALLHPWFDRQLSMAGRVSFVSPENRLVSKLIDFRRPLALIPNLPIHLNREANSGAAVNAQKELTAIIGQVGAGESVTFDNILSTRILEEHGIDPGEAHLDHDLFLYESEGASCSGLGNEFITGPRIDNLVSCYAGLRAALESREEIPFICVFTDHEEVGSLSFHGAASAFLRNILERLCPDRDDFSRAMSRSMLISMDNAHALHPNYPEKYDGNHQAIMNSGPVIKFNAGQSYATSGETSSVFRHLARSVSVPIQSFVMRSDMKSGSTIGPVTAAEVGVKTVDVGIPTLAMHSIRETAGAMDSLSLYRIAMAFLNDSLPRF